jgi:AraC family transcriptional regulator
MNVHWKNNRTPEAATLAHAQWQFDGVHIQKTKVLGGEMPAQPYQMHELHLMTQGRITTTRHTEDGRTRVDDSSGERMCIVPAGQTVSADWDDGFEMMVVAFTPGYLARMSLELTGVTNVHLVETLLPKDAVVESLGMAVLRQHRQARHSTLYGELMVRTLMLHVVHTYTDARPARADSGTPSPHKIRRAIGVMENNLTDDLTIASVAAAVNLSYFHFIRAFRDAVGLTPQVYITRRRLELAKTLLSGTDLPIIEVCANAGFKNQSHFTALFRKSFGVTPVGWRAATRSVSLGIDRSFSTQSATARKTRRNRAR